MDDEEFLANIPRILHFVCIISYLKEYGHFMFSDMGLVHELVHILHLGERETVQSLKEIRKKFDKLMELV